MLKLVHRALAVGGLGALAAPTAAADLNRSTDGYTYFHMSGAQRADHDRDIWECRAVAGQLRQEMMEPYSARAVREWTAGDTPLIRFSHGAGEAIAGSVFQAIEDSKTNRVNTENCMVAKGWEVVVVPPAEAKALSGKSLQAALDRWVGAAAPHGDVARTFRNDVAGMGTTRFAMAIKKGVSLSGEAVGAPKGAEAQALASRPPAYLPQPPASPRPPKGITVTVHSIGTRRAFLGALPAN